MRRMEFRRDHLEGWALCATCSLLFCFLEIATASLAPDWLGGALPLWIAAFFGWVIYTLALALIMELIAVILRLIPAGAAGEAARIPGSVFTASLIVWHLLRPSESSGLDLIVYAAFGTLAGVCIALRYTKAMPPWAWKSAWACALAAGIACLPLSHRLLFLTTERAPVCLVLAILWAVLSGVIAVAVAAFVQKARMRPVLGIALLAGFCASLPLVLWAAENYSFSSRNTERRGMLFITADALRADLCGVYGGEVPTPSLQQLAEQGTLFERSYSLAPWTHPSLPGLFASKYPPGMTPGGNDVQWLSEILTTQERSSYWLDKDGITIAHRVGALEKSASRPRATGMLMANSTFRLSRWLTDTFGHTALPDTLRQDLHGPLDLLPMLQKTLARVFPSLVRLRLMDATEWLVRYTKLYMRRYQNEPFFLWVHFLDPHEPYDPPKAFREEGSPRGSITAGDCLRDDRTVREEVVHQALDLYKGEIRYIDWAVGEILEEYEALDLGKTTYVCFSSDHGEAFLEHEYITHGNSFYDEEVRVPLIFAGPGIRAQRIEEPVSAIDLVPTFAKLLSLKASKEWRGTPLTQVLHAGERGALERPVFAQSNNPTLFTKEPLQMVVEGSLKLIRGRDSGSLELYDLKKDPEELVRLEKKRPEDCARLLRLIEEWTDSFPASFASLDQEREDGPREISEEAMELFRDIGYLGDD